MLKARELKVLRALAHCRSVKTEVFDFHASAHYGVFLLSAFPELVYNILDCNCLAIGYELIMDQIKKKKNND